MLHYMFLIGCISSSICQTDNIKNVNVLNNLLKRFWYRVFSSFHAHYTLTTVRSSLKPQMWRHTCENYPIAPHSVYQELDTCEGHFCVRIPTIKTHKPCFLASQTVYSVYHFYPLIQIFINPSNTITSHLNIVSDYSWVNHTYAWASVLHTLDALQHFACTLTSSFSSSV